jgi:pyruvate formate lyase activating enzyme
MQAAEFWHRLEDGRVQCDLCPHHCKLREGQTGLCRVRTVSGGELKAAAYGLLSSAHVDPIEKKPLYHFHPGSSIFSAGGWGCNFACPFCQNWTISQAVEPESLRVGPDQILREAVRSRCHSVAYTYNEPLVGFEFVRDCSRAVKEAGLVNVLVTNGHIEREPAAQLLPLTAALNIDIKSMDEDFYRKQCRGRLEPVLAFSKQAVDAGCHVEITNLVIPGLNDAPEQFERLARWIRENLGPSTPLHLSAYRPEYRLEVPATPAETLEQACRICRADLAYVYIGNVFTRSGQDTDCPQCGRTLIRRRGYSTEITGIKDNACSGCGRRADVVLGG